MFALFFWLIFLLKLFLLQEKYIFIFINYPFFVDNYIQRHGFSYLCALFVLIVFHEILKRVEMKKIFFIALISLSLLIPILMENTNVNENYFWKEVTLPITIKIELNSILFIKIFGRQGV